MVLTARFAAVLAAVSLVAPAAAAAQEKVNREDQFKACLDSIGPRGRVPPPQCLNLVAEDWDRWQNADVNEYGIASSLANWDERKSEVWPCDSLMDFMHRNLPLTANPRDDLPNTVFIYWMDFHEGDDLDRLNGLTVPLPWPNPLAHYVFLRRNYRSSMREQDVAKRKYHALAHELRHVMTNDGSHWPPGGNSVDTDGCTERRVDEEHRARDPDRVPTWSSVRTNCTVRTKWDCVKIEFDGIDDAPDHPDNPDPSGDYKECGLIYLGELERAYFVCKGAPIRVCLPREEVRCDGGGGGLGRAACAVPDADARRPRSGIRAAE